MSYVKIITCKWLQFCDITVQNNYVVFVVCKSTEEKCKVTGGHWQQSVFAHILYSFTSLSLIFSQKRESYLLQQKRECYLLN